MKEILGEHFRTSASIHRECHSAKNIISSVGLEEALTFGLESLTVLSELAQVCLGYSPACFAKWQHRVSKMLALNKQGDKCSYIRISGA